MTTTEAKALSEQIDEIKETEAPMPHVYHQGWQDACSRIAEEIAALHHADRGGDGQLREVASATEVTTEAMAKLLMLSRSLLSLSARVERLEGALYDLVEAVKREVNAGDSGSGYLLARLSDARAALTPKAQP